MLFLDVLVRSRNNQSWHEAQHHTSLSDVLTSPEGGLCPFSKADSVGLLVPYVRSILHVYVSVYHTLLSKPI